MKCGYCGKTVSEGLRFCPSCGAPLGQTPPGQQTNHVTDTAPVQPTVRQHVQYIPPDGDGPPPTAGPNRRWLWPAIAVGAVVILALAVLIPLLVTGGGDGTVLTSTTETTTTLAPATTTTAASTTTTLGGPVGDSSGSWVEQSVPGGPWAAQEVAVSDNALLIVTKVAAGYKLSAVLLETGETVTVSQSEALAGPDIDGLLTAWWEATGWDAATQTYAHVYIKTRLLPAGAKNTVSSAASVRLGMAQVASPWVAWVVTEPWSSDPGQYYAEHMGSTKVKDNGAPIMGSGVTFVPTALAFALGDSGWRYSLSSEWVAWENGADVDGYGPGTHVIGTDKSGHQSVGADVWRPSLWDNLLVYQDGSLKVKDLSTDATRTIDPSGDFATAGPTFAAYYKPSATGSFLATRGYDGGHEQTLGELNQPPYFCPTISVSANYIAYAFEDEIHLFKWQAQ